MVDQHPPRDPRIVIEGTPEVRRAEGVAEALRIQCPSCHTPLPEEIMALIRQLDALPPVATGPGSAHRPRP